MHTVATVADSLSCQTTNSVPFWKSKESHALTIIRNQDRTVNDWKVLETLGIEHKVSHFPELRFATSVE